MSNPYTNMMIEHYEACQKAGIKCDCKDCEFVHDLYHDKSIKWAYDLPDVRCAAARISGR